MTTRHRQTSIGKEVVLKGIGLHTGRKCRARFKPAPPDSGITFLRTDLPGAPAIKALVENVVDVVRGTTIGTEDIRIYTIEHILSTLCGLEIDNVTIELDESEPPVTDGSSLPYAELIHQAGRVEQPAEKDSLTPKNPFEYRFNNTILRIEPADTFEIFCTIDYQHPMIKRQAYTFKRGDAYAKIIAPARTYCFDYEIEALKKKGLAKGGSLDNAIVVGPRGIYNPGHSLRFDNEFVRHKILDLMGDLMLLGSRLQAKIFASRCGHGHNIKFLRDFQKKKSALPSLAP